MTKKEKLLIEENMSVIGTIVKSIMTRYHIPYSEYEDNCQIGYLILCEKVHRYDGSTKFNTFAETVLRNAFIDRYRLNRVHMIDTISLDEICTDDYEGDKADLLNFLASDVNTENEALAKIANDMLKEYLKKAKDRYSAHTTVKGFEALELKLQGYSGAEIANMFQVPANSLRAWMSRAKKILLNECKALDLLHN